VRSDDRSERTGRARVGVLNIAEEECGDCVGHARRFSSSPTPRATSDAHTATSDAHTAMFGTRLPALARTAARTTACSRRALGMWAQPPAANLVPIVIEQTVRAPRPHAPPCAAHTPHRAAASARTTSSRACCASASSCSTGPCVPATRHACMHTLKTKRTDTRQRLGSDRRAAAVPRGGGLVQAHPPVHQLARRERHRRARHLRHRASCCAFGRVLQLTGGADAGLAGTSTDEVRY
jgi:hypothetical protein